MTERASIDPKSSARLTVNDFPLSRAQLRKWDGWCLELVNELLHSHPSGDILYVDLEHDPLHRWKYHAAIVLDGLVYDPWHPSARLPPADYVREVFGDGTPWEINPGADDDAPDDRKERS